MPMAVENVDYCGLASLFDSAIQEMQRPMP